MFQGEEVGRTILMGMAELTNDHNPSWPFTKAISDL